MSIKISKSELQKLIHEEVTGMAALMQVAAQIASKLMDEVGKQAQVHGLDPEQLYQTVLSQSKEYKKIQSKNEE